LRIYRSLGILEKLLEVVYKGGGMEEGGEILTDGKKLRKLL